MKTPTKETDTAKQQTEGVLDDVACSAWMPIETAPRDGTPFVWVRYTAILSHDNPPEYRPEVDVLRRMWINEEKNGRKGDGFWMGQYISRGDADVSRGYWRPIPFLPNS